MPGGEVGPAPVAREVAAVIAPTVTGVLVPALRARVARSCQRVRPAGARQVSTATEVPSSAWPEKVVRRTRLSPLAQRASMSQLARRPSTVWPRTSTVIQLRLLVVATHEAISSVNANALSTHGERQRPVS